jgi:hypothetical protein
MAKISQQDFETADHSGVLLFGKGCGHVSGSEPHWCSSALWVAGEARFRNSMKRSGAQLAAQAELGVREAPFLCRSSNVLEDYLVVVS